MINVKFVKGGLLTYTPEYDFEKEIVMVQLFDGLETTLPIVPKVGDKLDLSTFVDLESMISDYRDLLSDQWCATVCDVYIERFSLRVHIMNSDVYQSVKDKHEN